MRALAVTRPLSSRLVVSLASLAAAALLPGGAAVAGGPGSGHGHGHCDAPGRGHGHGHDDAVTRRPIGDWLANNPQSFNVFDFPIDGTGSDRGVLINFGWDPHLFPTPDGTAALPVNPGIADGSDPFGFPGGFSSVLSLTEKRTRVHGTIVQTRRDDGGVDIVVDARVRYNAVSVYDEEDIFGVGGYGSGGPGGCSTAGGSVGTGCNDLPGGSGEPDALIGQDGDGRFDYELHVELAYTAEAVALAGGDLACGADPAIPFILPAFFGIVPGVEVTDFRMVGTITGHVTEDAAVAAAFGLPAGGEVAIRYVDTPEEFVVELIAP
ncbi:MAG: hypothetical protein KC635_22045 [Myxococcales bacterium]|nr:hypothetical protein [Myxococcales bacterium]